MADEHENSKACLQIVRLRHVYGGARHRMRWFIFRDAAKCGPGCCHDCYSSPSASPSPSASSGCGWFPSRHRHACCVPCAGPHPGCGYSRYSNASANTSASSGPGCDRSGNARSIASPVPTCHSGCYTGAYPGIQPRPGPDCKSDRYQGISPAGSTDQRTNLRRRAMDFARGL